jgi:hypothetical protein
MTDSWMRMRRPVHGEVHVHYGQIYVVSGPGGLAPGLQEAFGGQRGGLCGAATPGALFLMTGLHTGRIGFTVEVHEQAPPLDPEWEDVVEASFRPESADSALMEWAGQAAWELNLDEVDYRVRYCATGMDQARKQDTRGDEPQLDRYLLQFWPAPPGPDAVLKQTSAIAAHWHDYARELPPPPTPAERAEIERLGRILQEQADERARVARETQEWGGQLPSQTLREVRGNVRGVLRFDAALVHALDAAGPETQRAVALLAANRACEAAGLSDLDWVAAALTALAEGRALPPPFDDRAQLWQALKSDPRAPHRTVRQAIPPERNRPRATCAPAPGCTERPAPARVRSAEAGARQIPRPSPREAAESAAAAAREATDSAAAADAAPAGRRDGTVLEAHVRPAGPLRAGVAVAHGPSHRGTRCPSRSAPRRSRRGTRGHHHVRRELPGTPGRGLVRVHRLIARLDGHGPT